MGNGSVNTDDMQVPFLCLPAPCCQGANTCPKKEHIFFFFFLLSFLFVSQARSRDGNKGKKASAAY